MPEQSFEFRLERMFAEAPTTPDADYFAVRVLERLDRGWAARRFVIGVMGLLGGLIGGFELLDTGALGQLAGVWARSSGVINQHVAATLSAALGPTGLYLDPQVIWYAVALACVAAGFGLARLVREI